MNHFQTFWGNVINCVSSQMLRIRDQSYVLVRIFGCMLINIMHNHKLQIKKYNLKGAHTHFHTHFYLISIQIIFCKVLQEQIPKPFYTRINQKTISYQMYLTLFLESTISLSIYSCQDQDSEDPVSILTQIKKDPQYIDEVSINLTFYECYRQFLGKILQMSLALKKVEIKREKLQQMEEQQQLEKLKIGNRGQIDLKMMLWRDIGTVIFDGCEVQQIMRFLKMNPLAKLSRLTILNSEFTRKTIPNLFHSNSILQNLTSLNLQQTNLSTKTLIKVSLKNLQFLHLSNNKLHDSCSRILVRGIWQNLQGLTLEGNFFSDDGIKVLVELNNWNKIMSINFGCGMRRFRIVKSLAWKIRGKLV